MLSSERQMIILQKVNSDKVVKVSELIQLLDTSESTIRRDILELHELGKLKKVHGGALAIETPNPGTDQKVNARENISISEKQKIAKYAATLVEDNDLIFLDAGTSVRQMIQYINAVNVTAVTNCIRNAQELLAKGIKTIIIGGEVKPITEAIVGHKGVEALSKYNFRKAFMGANGVSITKGCTTPDGNEAVIKECAINRSLKSYVLADNSKIGQVSLVTFASLDQVTIITDAKIEENFETEVIEVNNKN